jgi:hypothetical protein
MSIGARTWIWLCAVVLLLLGLVVLAGWSGPLQLVLLLLPIVLVAGIGAGLRRAGASTSTIRTVSWVVGVVVALAWLGAQMRTPRPHSNIELLFSLPAAGVQAWFLHALVEGGAGFVEEYRSGRGVEA